MKVLLTSSATTAAAINPHFTVEAEYGSVLVQGSVLTLAHHEAGRAQGFSVCPCLNPNADYEKSAWAEYVGQAQAMGHWDAELHAWEAVCVVSHVDWDTLGGVLSLMNAKPTLFNKVWEFIAHNDENGPHRGHEFGPIAPAAQDAANAMYAWLSQPEQRVFAPRDGSALDITDFIGRVKNFLTEVLHDVQSQEDPAGCPYGHLSRGRDWAKAQSELDTKSFIDTWGVASGYIGGFGDFQEAMPSATADVQLRHCDGGSWVPYVYVRSSEAFVNHLYNHGGVVASAVVGFNQKTGAITLSFESGAKSPLSASEIMQEVFGPLAGGHRGIAGTPRDQVYTLADAEALAEKVTKKLQAA